MTHLDLSREDAETLAAVIESTLSDLRYEISNTDSMDFRETLKKKKATLIRVLDQLTVPRQLV